MSKRKDHDAPITSVALLKREAAELLVNFKKKPIVAIDLDYTVGIFLSVGILLF
jgi:hypothetical protein